MTVYDFTVKDRKGNDVSLSEYKGKVLLIVNTATGCGFTPHYEPLEAMYKDLRDKGFEILDFPSNQFAGQAPGSRNSPGFGSVKVRVTEARKASPSTAPVSALTPEGTSTATRMGAVSPRRRLASCTAVRKSPSSAP